MCRHRVSATAAAVNADATPKGLQRGTPDKLNQAGVEEGRNQQQSSVVVAKSRPAAIHRNNNE